jgi:PTS system galactitol-specific IIB component
MKTILVVCGSGIATSTAAVGELESKFKERNINVNIIQCDVFSVNSNLRGVSLIASTCALKGDYGVPIINVIPLLTGIGEEKVIDEILSYLND